MYHCRVAETKRTRPEFVVPMAAHAVRELPEGPEWLYELKLDGYRALVIKDGDQISIVSRNAKNLTLMYPSIVAAARRLRSVSLVIDGELVALDETGRPSFQALQHRGEHPGHLIVFYAFDLLHLEGCDLTGESLELRRDRLRTIVPDEGRIKISQALPGSVQSIVEAVRSAGLEGVIAKRRGSTYQSGDRSRDWLKLKLDLQQEFVVGGYRPTGPHDFDALLVGHYEGNSLRFAGKVRAGFVPHTRRQLVEQFRPLGVKRCPFSNLPDATSGRWGGGVTADQMNEMQWTKPHVVVQIRFVEWTSEGRLRHASFLGVRSDKDPRRVLREL